LILQGCVFGYQQTNWIDIYNLFIIVILPSIFSGIFNSLIFISVRSSTRRVHALTPAVNSNHQNTRDIYLLKHMIFIFIIFIIGWAPIYIRSIIQLNNEVTLWFGQFLQLLPVISSLIIILDLFYYNHELRQYLKEKLPKLENFRR